MGTVMSQANLEQHRTDTRAKTVKQTETGLAIIRQGLKVIEKFDHSFFDRLGSGTKNLNHQLMQLKQNQL